MIDSYKHSNLLHYRINYDREMFYESDKHSSLLRDKMNYGRKNIYGMEP